MGRAGWNTRVDKRSRNNVSIMDTKKIIKDLRIEIRILENENRLLRTQLDVLLNGKISDKQKHIHH